MKGEIIIKKNKIIFFFMEAILLFSYTITAMISILVLGMFAHEIYNKINKIEKEIPEIILIKKIFPFLNQQKGSNKK